MYFFQSIIATKTPVRNHIYFLSKNYFFCITIIKCPHTQFRCTGHLDCFCLTVCKCIPHYLFYLISTNSQCSFSFSRINQAIFIDNHSVFLRMLFPPPWYFFHSPYDFQIRKFFEYNFLRFFASTKCIGKNLLHSFRNNDRLQ